MLPLRPPPAAADPGYPDRARLLADRQACARIHAILATSALALALTACDGGTPPVPGTSDPQAQPNALPGGAPAPAATPTRLPGEASAPLPPKAGAEPAPLGGKPAVTVPPADPAPLAGRTAVVPPPPPPPAEPAHALRGDTATPEPPRQQPVPAKPVADPGKPGAANEPAKPVKPAEPPEVVPGPMVGMMIAPEPPPRETI